MEASGLRGGHHNLYLVRQYRMGEEIKMNSATTAGRRMPTYRALAQDFDDEGPNDRFDLDVIYHGPQLGVVFHF